MFNEDGKFMVPVIFSDEFIQTDPAKIALDRVRGRYLPYLFAGYFYGQNFGKWFFSNAVRHEEMKTAVLAYLEREVNFAYGQLVFNDRLLSEAKFKFQYLIAHEELPKGADHQLRRQIRRDRFTPDFKIRVAK